MTRRLMYAIVTATVLTCAAAPFAAASMMPASEATVSAASAPAAAALTPTATTAVAGSATAAEYQAWLDSQATSLAETAKGQAISYQRTMSDGTSTSAYYDPATGALEAINTVGGKFSVICTNASTCWASGPYFGGKAWHKIPASSVVITGETPATAASFGATAAFAIDGSSGVADSGKTNIGTRVSRIVFTGNGYQDVTATEFASPSMGIVMNASANTAQGPVAPHTVTAPTRIGAPGDIPTLILHIVDGK